MNKTHRHVETQIWIMKRDRNTLTTTALSLSLLEDKTSNHLIKGIRTVWQARNLEHLVWCPNAINLIVTIMLLAKLSQLLSSLSQLQLKWQDSMLFDCTKLLWLDTIRLLPFLLLFSVSFYVSFIFQTLTSCSLSTVVKMIPSFPFQGKKVELNQKRSKYDPYQLSYTHILKTKFVFISLENIF